MKSIRAQGDGGPSRLTEPDRAAKVSTRQLAPHRSILALLALGIGCLAALIVGEIAVRLVEPIADTQGVALTASGRVFGYAPNSVGFAGGVSFSTNDEGFRGADFSTVDPERDFVIVVLGDSYAFGYGVKLQQAFPSLLEARLQRDYPGRRVRVLNLGIPGYDTSQELAVLKDWQGRLRPRLVLLQYHLNDIERHVGSTDSTPGDSPGAIRGFLTAAERHLHLLRFVLPRLAAVARALGWHVETTVTSEVDEYVHNGAAWQRNQATLGELFRTAQEAGAKVAVLVVPYVVQLTDRHPPLPAYDAVVQFCRADRVPVISAFDYFKGQSARALWINAFDGHPNAAGHVLIADAALALVRATQVLEVK